MREGQRTLSTFLGDAPGGREGGEDGSDGPDGTEGPARATEPVPGEEPLSVSELTMAVKQRLRTDPALQDVHVAGEASNVRTSARGHMYFTLKDEACQLPCVMWSRGGAPAASLEEGDKVLARGRIDVYEAHGRYQLVVSSLSKRGLGDLYQRFLELKARLEREGLFAEERKRPLPMLPRRVGVVTSAGGSVFHDVVRVIRRRYPHVTVTLAHASVQGEAAASELVDGLSALAALGDVEVIIIGRGGGSIEDLWPFNEEAVARAIAACPVPVVSGVGHETDFTISDFVADLRAPTPSAAAEVVVPKLLDELRGLEAAGQRLVGAVAGALGRAQERLDALARSPFLARPEEMLELRRQRLDDVERRFELAAGFTVDRESSRLEALTERLLALSPMGTLERGYAIALDAGGDLVSSAADLSAGDGLEVVLRDGRVDTRVTSVSRKGDDT